MSPVAFLTLWHSHSWWVQWVPWFFITSFERLGPQKKCRRSCAWLLDAQWAISWCLHMTVALASWHGIVADCKFDESKGFWIVLWQVQCLLADLSHHQDWSLKLRHVQMAPMDIGKPEIACKLGGWWRGSWVFWSFPSFSFQTSGRYYNNLEAFQAYDNLWCRCNADSALCFGRQGLRTTKWSRESKLSRETCEVFFLEACYHSACLQQNVRCTSGRIGGWPSTGVSRNSWWPSTAFLTSPTKRISKLRKQVPFCGSMMSIRPSYEER